MRSTFAAAGSPPSAAARSHSRDQASDGGLRRGHWVNASACSAPSSHARQGVPRYRREPSPSGWPQKTISPPLGFGLPGGWPVGIARKREGMHGACARGHRSQFHRRFRRTMPSRLQHEARGFHAEAFDGIGGGRAGFFPEHPAELSGAEVRDLCEFLDRQLGCQVLLRIRERCLNPVRFRIELEQRRMLRLPARPAVIDDHFLGDDPRDLGAKIFSTSAIARSRPALMPADVHPGRPRRKSCLHPS